MLRASEASSSMIRAPQPISRRLRYGSSYCAPQFAQCQWFCQILEGAGLQDGGSGLTIAVRGDDDDLGARRPLVKPLENHEAVHAGQGEIEHHDVGGQLVERGEPCLPIPADLRLEAV